MTNASEVPFFFSRGRSRLFGFLHEPIAPGVPLGYVLSHPFGEEKLWSHRVLVSVARALAARGHAVLRFDYAGAGDSEGEARDASVETHLADLRAAVEALAERRPELRRVGIIGLRLGATIAALLAEDAAGGAAPGILREGPLVLWDPVVEGAAYVQEVLRANLSAQLATHGKVIETREVMSQRILDGGVVNVDGYEIARPLFASLGEVSLVGGARRHAGPVFVAAIAPPGKLPKPQPALDALAAAYGRGTSVSVEEFQFWREIKQFYGRASRLQSATLDWLGSLDG